MKTKITLFLLAILYSSFSLSQIQMGDNIKGDFPGDAFGESVAISANGLRVAVGAPFNDGNGNDSGQVKVYDWNGFEWIRVGSEINGEFPSDLSGVSLSLSANGNTMAIGAPNNDVNGSRSGHVRVYKWGDGDWRQAGADIDGEDINDDSGFSISLSSDGNRLAVGAPFSRGQIHQFGSERGQLKVYGWDGTNWNQLGFDIEGEEEFDRCGWSASLSGNGNRLAVGAPRNDGAASDGGQVRVFGWNGNQWTQLGFDIDGPTPFDYFGTSVCLSEDGSTLAVAAPRNDGNGIWAGSVSIFRWNGTDWFQIGENIEGPVTADEFGYALSLSSDATRLAVGTYLNDFFGENAGLVKLYEWSGQVWNPLGEDLPGEEAGDFFGWSVALSGNGHKVAVGAREFSANGTGKGYVQVFDLAELTDVKETSETEFQVSPNPTFGKIEIKGANFERLKIVDQLGRLCLQENSGKALIDLSFLSAGVYWLQIFSGEAFAIKKIVVL